MADGVPAPTHPVPAAGGEQCADVGVHGTCQCGQGTSVLYGGGNRGITTSGNLHLGPLEVEGDLHSFGLSLNPASAHWHVVRRVLLHQLLIASVCAIVGVDDIVHLSLRGLQGRAEEAIAFIDCKPTQY